MLPKKYHKNASDSNSFFRCGQELLDASKLELMVGNDNDGLFLATLAKDLFLMGLGKGIGSTSMFRAFVLYRRRSRREIRKLFREARRREFQQK
jgi:hypothetical protein